MSAVGLETRLFSVSVWCWWLSVSYTVTTSELISSLPPHCYCWSLKTSFYMKTRHRLIHQILLNWRNPAQWTGSAWFPVYIPAAESVSSSFLQSSGWIKQVFLNIRPKSETKSSHYIELMIWQNAPELHCWSTDWLIRCHTSSSDRDSQSFLCRQLDAFKYFSVTFNWRSLRTRHWSSYFTLMID